MKYKKLISAVTAACTLLCVTGCGTDKSKMSEDSTISSASESSTGQRKKITAIGSAPKISLITPDKVKKYTHSNKAFSLEGYTTSLFMENGWEIVTGGEATDNQTDRITSFPAVIQYLDTKDTLTITASYEKEENFTVNSEETYIDVYGDSYDSINITSFENITIDEFDSIKIIADVVIKDESYRMTHILSDDVSGKYYSWLLLDNTGKFEDFDLVKAIAYPRVIDISTNMRKKRLDELRKSISKKRSDIQ